MTFWILDSRILIVFLIFKPEKSEENFLCEGIDILKSPSQKRQGLTIDSGKRAGEFPIGGINSVTFLEREIKENGRE